MELKEVMNVMQVSGERIPSGYYKKPEVDAVIAEKDAEIAELQETNVIIANNSVRLNKEIAELKQKLDKAIAERDGNQVCIDALKKKLENVQASMYCDVVDAGMRERRLKRALWLARANHADTMQKYNIECKCDGWVHRVDKWINVERKCRAMAENY